MASPFKRIKAAHGHTAIVTRQAHLQVLLVPLQLGGLPPLAREAAPHRLAHAHGLLQLGRRELLRLLRRTRSAGCGAGGGFAARYRR